MGFSSKWFQERLHSRLWWSVLVISALRGWKQEGLGFEVSLNCIARPHLTPYPCKIKFELQMEAPQASKKAPLCRRKWEQENMESSPFHSSCSTMHVQIPNAWKTIHWSRVQPIITIFKTFLCNTVALIYHSPSTPWWVEHLSMASSITSFIFQSIIGIIEKEPQNKVTQNIILELLLL